MQPTTQIEQITPDFANYVLTTKNKNNRSFKAANLKRLITTIENDEWMVTHQGIAFDNDGNLLDGQHRLQAIAKTGKTLPMMVTRNLDSNIFNCVDRGTARSAADGLFIQGCFNSKQLAAGIKVYLLYHAYPKGAWANVVMPSHIEISNEYNSKKDLWDNISVKICQYHKKFHFFNMSVAIAMYKLILDNNYSENIFEPFWRQLAEGINLQSDNPILSFRNQMMQKGFRHRGSSYQRYQLNAFIRLFNFYINGVKKTRFVAPLTDTPYVLKINPPTPRLVNEGIV